MSIPVNVFMWVMAFLPILLLLILMIVFQWGATEAAPVGLLVSVFTGIVFYKADIQLIAAESAKGIWNALVILLIVWTAILMYQVGDEAKAFLVIRNGMRKLLPNELLLVFAMGWVFESFLQGITGFGVPVVVGAPLLIGIGVSPLWAVAIPLLGQSWGNTFGTLAAAWDSLVMSTGLTAGSETYLITALWTAGFIAFWNLIVGIAICWLYGKGKALKKGFPAALIIAVIQGGGEILLSQANTTISCFVPSVIALLVLLLLGRTSFYNREWRVEESPIMKREQGEESKKDTLPDMTLLQAFVPYILLSVISMAVLLITPINSFLQQFQFGFAFPETSTGYGYVTEAVESFSALAVFTHASMFLFLSSVIGLIYYKCHGWIGKNGVGRILKKSVCMTMSSGMAVIGLVIMSRIMGGTGQITVLAEGIANVLGKAYVILAPFIGLLGTFMTGSNMSSNILFGDFQMTTASILEVNAAAVLGAQSAGGAIGSAISPSKIILGTTTVNIPGKEGEVMKRLILITVSATIAMGLLLYVLMVL